MAHFSLLFQFEAQPARTSSPVHTQQAVKGEGDGEALIHDIQPITPTVSSVPIGGACPKVPRQICQGKHSSSSSSALTSSDSARSFKM